MVTIFRRIVPSFCLTSRPESHIKTFQIGIEIWFAFARIFPSFSAETKSMLKTGRSKPSPLFSTGKKIFRYSCCFQFFFFLSKS